MNFIEKDMCLLLFTKNLIINVSQAIPLSVDLWLHFLNYEKTSDKKDSVEHVREQYNIALNACGKEFRSDKIWDSFVKYEVSFSFVCFC